MYTCRRNPISAYTHEVNNVVGEEKRPVHTDNNNTQSLQR